MAFHLYTVLVVAIVAVCVNSFAITEEQKAAVTEQLKADATECGKQHGVTLEQVKKWNEEKKTPDDTNKCFYACMFKKRGVLNDQGLFDEKQTEGMLKHYLPEDKQNEVNAAVKTCAAVNDKPVGDGAAGCDRAALLLTCFREQRDALGIHFE